MADETERERPADDPLREGIRTIAGMLGALKDALEETFDELRERGDLSPDRARDAARSTMRKAQASFEEMRERVDFVTRKEHEALQADVALLRADIDALRARLTARDGEDAAAAAEPQPDGDSRPRAQAESDEA